VLPDGTTVRGAVRVEGDGQARWPAGRHRHPRGQDLVVAGREAGDIPATIALADRSATFDAAAERFATRARGLVGIDAPFPGHADVRSPGWISARCRCRPTRRSQAVCASTRRGVRSACGSGVVSAVIEELDARWNDQPVTLRAPATRRWRTGR
jgi:hypothetical protein